MRLENRVAVVTGAAAGIGRGIAILFAKEGCRVVIADVNDKAGEQVANEVRAAKGEASFFHTNVAEAESVRAMVQKTIDRYDRVDVLVNNAGISPEGSVESTTEEDWNRVIDTNLKGAFLCCKHVVPYMKQVRYGSIVNMSSTDGLHGDRNRVAYSASKGGIIAFTMAMAIDLAEFNIRVNCICPGSILTPMLERLIADSPDPKRAMNIRLAIHPIGRLGTPEDVAYAALYLASTESSFMTGTPLVLDGGASCGALAPKGV